MEYIKKIQSGSAIYGFELTGCYTYFNNRIIADFDTDPNNIIYDNLNGFAESNGLNTNIELVFTNGLKLLACATFMSVATIKNGKRTP